ncbi:hypothetical protein Prum_052620 [Phytohabitans rumicis]|uniref:Uncharacterized protein n=1 Tax=Phytohabitans rumicis TaxID=1076125 RepID=A0A6V8L7V5_9ACTN|nr:hypothetical protein Prum_052620 [Phytohabitans rumicis]
MRTGVQQCVVHAEDTEIDPGAAAGPALTRDAGVLHGGPRNLQQHPLLGVHFAGLARRDAEELGVETVDVGEVTTDAGGGEQIGTGPLRRHRADDVNAAGQDPP